jgi:hypothetical protein
MPRARLSLVVTLLAGLAGASTLSARQTPEGDARDAALRWVALVDAGDYGASWTATGTPFRRRVTQEQWQTAVQASREPLGVLQSRTPSSARPSSSLPGAPDGEYVVLQFQTAFAHKASAVETITMVREADGAWRVIGYFVR